MNCSILNVTNCNPLTRLRSLGKGSKVTWCGMGRALIHIAWPAKFCKIFISHFAKFSNSFREIFEFLLRNFRKVILQNCRETKFIYFLMLNSYRNLNFNSIFHYFVNKICCEGNFLRDSPFKGTVSQDFLLWFSSKGLSF